MNFVISVEPDESGTYVAEALALPGCVTQGKTEAEAMERIREAILAWLEAEAEKRLGAKRKGSLREVAA
jgi:predicted RNase H-like HicB family nuclease